VRGYDGVSHVYHTLLNLSRWRARRSYRNWAFLSLADRERNLRYSTCRHGWIHVRQARLSQTRSLNKDVSRDRYSLDSYTAVTGVSSAHGGECFSRNGGSNKQVTRSIPRVATLVCSQQDTSRYLLICTDSRDTDTAADVSYKSTRTVTPSGAPSQSPIVLYKKQDFTASIYQTGCLFNYKRSTRDGEL
jgi:hypothetical protein